MSGARPISSLDLSPGIRTKLTKAGFQTVRDLEETTPVDLSKGISTDDALKILQQTKRNTVDAMSASEVLVRERLAASISTSSNAIDNMLGGGVPIRKITEFCGAPGIGKTQFGIQLSVNVQIPETLSGPEGEAVYIDTEGSFIAQRAAEIASAMVERVNGHQHAGTEALVNVDTILSKIHYFRLHNCVELIALVKVLDEFLKEHSKVKIIIIDSIAFHFRHGFSDMALRTRILNSLAQDLTKIAHSFNLAVVIFNQMTTKFFVSSDRSATDQAILIPALGESWAHQCNNRIILYWQDGIRCANLIKSANRREQIVTYQIGATGIRDVIDDASSSRKRPREDLND
ncbi:3067_t:CDS:2 [Paraglomus brasilianum]|uniref:DNA repair protein RAD51 homolog 3 n=1 Tax=Paraglomus brasilianum TaxID=144538 RepID=A0A9N8ZGZ9_9GLOM|nr:3067_t:CDS:2 [Paraglomus brasilianum]